jgi:hypothetical protein
LRHEGVPEERRTDYVPTKSEVKEYRHIMISEAAKLRSERKNNEELLPEDDGVGRDVQNVKD